MDTEFKAYKADGTILYVANALSNPSQYLALYLDSGYIHLRLKSSLGIERHLQLLGRYNDAEFHKVTI